MRHFIFITDEGTTFQPDSDFAELEVDNCQVLGFSDGVDEQEAFEKLLINNSWLKKSSFDEVIAFELTHSKSVAAFNIQNSNGA